MWSDTDQKYQGARIIFTDTERSNWTWDPVAKQYFWHRFFSHQPDLNYDNPEVQEEMLNVMRFWLRMGVDGFRCDAVPYLFEREGTNCENLPETHAFLKRLRATIDREFQGRVLLAEANQWPSDVRVYFGDGDEFHMGFHFPVMPRIFMSVRREERTPIVEIMQQTPDIPENCQWAIFLRNHDELTLEMVTDEDRDYMYREYAKDPRMKLNLGIRRRLAPLMDSGRRRLELLHSLLFSLPGTPVMYYGDEIGMGDNIFLGDRNGVRTPMQWTPDRNAGFSRADYARLYAPVIADTVYGYQALNVEAQEATPGSLPQLGSRAHPGPQAAPGPLDGQAPVRESAEQEGDGLRPPGLRGDTALRLQPRPGGATCRARPLRVAGLDPGGALRGDGVPAHHRPAVPALARCLWLLLVPAASPGGGSAS